MIILYNSDIGDLVRLHRKLERIFLCDTVVPFLALDGALEYLNVHIPDAVYTEATHGGELLIYQLRKEGIKTYCAYISNQNEYRANPWIHLGKTAAVDYFDLYVSEDMLKSSYLDWKQKNH